MIIATIIIVVNVMNVCVSFLNLIISNYYL